VEDAYGLIFLTTSCSFFIFHVKKIDFQPGNGKVNIKEPKELSKKAMKQIQQAIDLAKE